MYKKISLFFSIILAGAIMMTACASQPSPVEYAQADAIRAYSSYQIDSQLAARVEAARAAGYSAGQRDSGNGAFLIWMATSFFISVFAACSLFVIFILRNPHAFEKREARMPVTPERLVQTPAGWLLLDPFGRARRLSDQEARTLLALYQTSLMLEDGR